MPVALVMDFPGGTKENYDNVVGNMQLDGRMAPGGLFHAAGATADGWRVIDVWESMDAFQRFAEEKIMPLTAAEGMQPPSIEHIEVHTQLRGEDGEPVLVQVVHAPDADAATYEAVNERILPSPGQAPGGCVFHVAGPVEGGWCIVDAWTSREARDRLLGEQIVPALREVGYDNQPRFDDLEVEATLA